jgi:hypothetical protein
MISNSFLTKILKTDPYYIDLAFGQKGFNLFSFVKEIDIKHPGLKEIDSLKNNSELLTQYLDLVIYLKKNNMDLALGLLKSKFDNSFSELLGEFGNPLQIRRYFRFLPKDKIKILRSQKKKQIFSSRNFHERASKIWSACPFDFSVYENKNWQEEIQKYKCKSDFFKNIGCHELSKAICDFSSLLDSDFYFNFKKINVFYACVVLAKMNAFKIKDNRILAGTKKGSFLYAPTLMSIFSFKQIPKEIKKIIEQLDYPFPMFDNYIAIVPSTDANFNDLHSCEELLEKNIKFVVLGEKDKNCYFICSSP